jgi:hypothetical protein
MDWLTVAEYECHKWWRICSICRNHNPVLSSCMPYHRGFNKSNSTDATCWTITAYPSESPGFTPVFSGVRGALSLVFCAMFCRSLFVLLSIFFWPLYCLSFDLRLLITPFFYTINENQVRLLGHVLNTILWDSFLRQFVCFLRLL